MLWTLGDLGVPGVWVSGETLSECSGQAQHSESTERERERERERESRLRPWGDTGQHPQTSMGWPKRKNYTHSFNAFYIIHIHFDILQGRRLTHSPRNDSHFLGFYFSPLIPYIFHSVRSAVDVFLVPNIARHSEFYGKMLNHCG